MPDDSQGPRSPTVRPVADRGRFAVPIARQYAGRDAEMAPSRESLCVALDALGAHREAVTVVGAHAVLERTRGLDVVALATKDADLALTPALVAEEPHLDAAMRAAGFRTLAEIEAEAREHDPQVRRRYEAQPGLWATGMTEAGEPVGEVDLLVPTSIAGGGLRSARALKRHGKQATRHTPGLELVVLDRSLMKIENFVDGTVREAWVAGHAGLLCAKAYKLGERIRERDSNGRNRVRPKDAIDVWRLLATSDGAEVRAVFDRHLDDERSGEAIQVGLDHLRTIIGDGHVRSLVGNNLVGAVPESDVSRVVRDWYLAFQGEQ